VPKQPIILTDEIVPPQAVKQFFDWCDERRLELHQVEAITSFMFGRQSSTVVPTIG
jgi:hypothetical protein